MDFDELQIIWRLSWSDLLILSKGRIKRRRASGRSLQAEIRQLD